MLNARFGQLLRRVPRGPFKFCFDWKSKKMSRRFWIVVLAAALAIADSKGEPLEIHPANPHYYLFDGHPILLITSAEHYGAV